MVGSLWLVHLGLVDLSPRYGANPLPQRDWYPLGEDPVSWIPQAHTDRGILNCRWQVNTMQLTISATVDQLHRKVRSPSESPVDPLGTAVPKSRRQALAEDRDLHHSVGPQTKQRN